MTKNSAPQFAICVNTDDPDLLTPRMIYETLPDANAAKSNYLRVIDNEGEDYLCPVSYFILIDLPRAVERALLHAAPPALQSKRARRGRRASCAPRNKATGVAQAPAQHAQT